LKRRFEDVNYETGEIEEFETSVDLDLLQEYNDWVMERKLHPPQATPREYAEYIEAKQLKDNVEKAIAVLQRYNMAESLPISIFNDVLDILNGEDKDGSQ
jgi:hypothetical protein